MRSLAMTGVFVQIFCAFQLFVQCTVALQYFVHSLVRDAEFGVEYKQIIEHGSQLVWRYRYDRKLELPGDTFAVQTKVEQQVENSAVTFEVRHFHQSLEWSLPMKSSSGRVYRSAKRTLCADSTISNYSDGGDHDDVGTVQITVSTQNRQPVLFTLEITWENNTIKSFGKNVQAQISPSSPAQYRMVVKQNTFSSRYSLLYITSKDDVCCTVSVKHSSCFRGLDQIGGLDELQQQQLIRSQHTMTRKSAINLKREDLNKGNLLVTFSVHEDSSICGVPNEKTIFVKNNLSLSYNGIFQDEFIKTVEFSLVEKIGDDVYLFATVGTFVCLLFFCIGFATFFWTHLRMVSVIFNSANQQQQRQNNRQHTQDINPCRLQPTATPITAVVTLPPPTTSNQEKMQVQDEDLCCMFFLVSTPSLKQSKHNLQDNCRKCARDIAKSTRRYVGTLSVVAAFYALPVLQFVLLYQQVLNDTGNDDLCYYNFMCLHPFGNLTTFNHMYSNLGYVMLGLLFICIVHVEQNRKWSCDENEPNYVEQHGEEERGLHSHYGIFYAMGVALTMEGLMSAFYHVCPNRLNYQFDMCFMYVVAMLCLVKLFQGRHPDMAFSALMAYGSLAMVVLLVAAGVFLQTWYFWCAITFIHFGIVFLMSLHLYSLGNWRIGWPALSKSENTGYFFSSICYPFRHGINWMTILLIFMNISNWLGAGLGYVLFFEIHDIATHLVFVLLINLLLYSLIYLLLKIKYCEKVLWPTWLYVALSIPFWFIGLYLFIFQRVDGWHLSQAESRNLNEECILWNFYDWHDIWHFLSAFGIFFMFMFFFTLDDDLRNVKRTNIKVF